jgi:hypothetical protein
VDHNILDLLEEFADLFNCDAESVDDELVRELLADLAAVVVEGDGTIGEEIAEELVGLLAELAAKQPRHASHCAEHLTELAAQVPGRPQLVLLAGVDHALGGLAAVEGRWGEAGTRMARVRPLLGPDLFPDGLPACDHVLGEIAFQRGDTNTAQRRWEAARAGFLAAGCWEDAAVATGGLAEIAERAGNVDGRAEELWGETADLFTKGGDAESARKYAAHACRLALDALRSMADDADTTAAFARARVARELAVRHGLAIAAMELLNCAAIFGADQGLPWPEVASWFVRAREECRALSGQATDEKIEVYLAGIGLAEGSAAMGRNLPVEAEAALRPALPVFQAHGCTLQEAVVVRMLAGIRRFLEPDPVSALDMLRNLYPGGAAPLNPGDAAQPAGSNGAFAVLDRADAAAGNPLEHQTFGLSEHQAFGLAVLDARQALERGDPRPAKRCLDQIEDHLATVGPTIYRGAVHSLEMLAGMLRAGLAQHTGGRPAAIAALAQVEVQMLATGAGLLAAQVAVQRGRMLVAEGDAAEAVRMLVPAVLALDAVRFNLDGADRRRRWTAAVAEGFDTAYRAAARLSDTRLLAELLEVARANAVPSPVPQNSSATLDALLAAADIEGAAAASDSAEALAGAVTLSGMESRTLLGLPAYLRTPWGTVALAEQLARARRYHDPVRANIAVGWRVRENSP